MAQNANLPLPRELRDEIYSFASDAIIPATQPNTTTCTIRGDMLGLLNMNGHTGAEARKMFLKGPRMMVLADFEPKAKGDNREMAAALVPFLVEIEKGGFNLRRSGATSTWPTRLRGSCRVAGSGASCIVEWRERGGEGRGRR